MAEPLELASSALEGGPVDFLQGEGAQIEPQT